jgi:hypothetical protein
VDFCTASYLAAHQSQSSEHWLFEDCHRTHPVLFLTGNAAPNPQQTAMNPVFSSTHDRLEPWRQCEHESPLLDRIPMMFLFTTVSPHAHALW